MIFWSYILDLTGTNLQRSQPSHWSVITGNDLHIFNKKTSCTHPLKQNAQKILRCKWTVGVGNNCGH